MNKNEAMEAFLMDFEGRRDGSIVTGFLVIAELALPSSPQATAYSYFLKGTPSMLLGLADQMRWVVRQEVQGRTEL